MKKKSNLFSVEEDATPFELAKTENQTNPSI